MMIRKILFYKQMKGNRRGSELNFPILTIIPTLNQIQVLLLMYRQKSRGFWLEMLLQNQKYLCLYLYLQFLLLYLLLLKVHYPDLSLLLLEQTLYLIHYHQEKKMNRMLSVYSLSNRKKLEREGSVLLRVMDLKKRPHHLDRNMNLIIINVLLYQKSGPTRN
ncbi:hypothetical protein RhiirB3_223691 [Rhizophagus irregularis]|nr:hypothetical protein RhiirB3_223691 [Rhizophagus irregularis]